jgi:DNA-binding PadR family transcriptional regulator
MTTRSEAEPPLTPLTLAILLALADGASHGYALMTAIEAQTDGAVRPGTGTLYAALRRLTDDGVIEELAAPADESVDARRRYYGLTAAGRMLLREELARMARLVELGRRKSLLGEA